MSFEQEIRRMIAGFDERAKLPGQGLAMNNAKRVLEGILNKFEGKLYTEDEIKTAAEEVNFDTAFGILVVNVDDLIYALKEGKQNAGDSIHN